MTSNQQNTAASEASLKLFKDKETYRFIFFKKRKTLVATHKMNLNKDISETMKWTIRK